MTTRTIDVHGTHIELHEVLSIVEQGVEVVLTDGATPLARVVPVQAVATTRVAGLHSHLGSARMSDDFGEPLPEAFWEGRDEAAAG